MIITEIDITIQAGNGGDGKSSFSTTKDPIADGGDGGRGGEVYLIGTNNLQALNRFTENNEIKAEDGKEGETGHKIGRNGKDLILKLPIGCTVTDKQSGFVYKIENKKKKIKVAKGGRGGRGNWSFRNYRKFSNRYHEKGLPGTKRKFFIELKLIADYGLIGRPNAGKSSLLNELTRTKAKVASYPFTTLEPNIGTLGDKVIADIPGLIEGASEGRGLGIKFLKHIEKVSLLLHCVPADSSDVEHDYRVVTKEIHKFKSELLTKDKIILLTKTDTTDKDDIITKTKILTQYGYPVIPISIHDWDSLQKLKKSL